MKSRFTFLLGGLVLAAMPLALAQTGGLRLPKTVEAGSGFSVQSSGSGKAVLYIVGPGQVLRRNVQLGNATLFAPGDLHNAGHYLVALVGDSSTEDGAFDVIAASPPAALSFLAKPSRLAVNLHEGISGVVYVFDTFQNLVLTPAQVSFQLSGIAGAVQTRTALTHNGVAWTKMNSAAKEGASQFVARVGDAASTRVRGLRWKRSRYATAAATLCQMERLSPSRKPIRAANPRLMSPSNEGSHARICQPTAGQKSRLRPEF